MNLLTVQVCFKGMILKLEWTHLVSHHYSLGTLILSVKASKWSNKGRELKIQKATIKEISNDIKEEWLH